jgi:hypothetical protein
MSPTASQLREYSQKRRKTVVSTERIIDAFLDLTDGQTWTDIRAVTGLADKRCQEILSIRNKIVFARDGYN